MYGTMTSQRHKSVQLRSGPPKKVEGATPKTSKEAVKKDEKNVEPPSVEPTPDGHYELSPLLSKILEAELQDVMKKVYELQATDPQDAAEKIVVKRFRNKAGDALRNTLGLNITKRLLNVHNPLYVKMVFSGKPLRAELVAFLKKYSVSAFKRVGEKGGTFAAKMRTYQDFDDLCNDKNLMCGKIHVTVTPCYQFMICPSNVRTPYLCKEAKKNNDAASSEPSQAAVSQKNKAIEKNIEKDTASQQTVIPKDAPTKSNQATSTAKETQEAKVTPKTSPAKVDNKPAAPAKAGNADPTKTTPISSQKSAASQIKEKSKEVPPQNNQTTATKIDSKPSPTAKETPTKNNQNTTKSNLVKAQNSPASQKATPQNSTAKETPVKETQSQNAAKITPKVATPSNVTTLPTPEKTFVKVVQSQNTSKVTPKVATPTKTVTQAQNSATNVAQAQNTTKPTPKVATPVKSTTQAENVTKVVPRVENTKKAGNTPLKTTTKPVTANNPKIVKKVATPKTAIPKVVNKPKVTPKKKPSDFDELDDHDILALISEGIVLDECSGSDVE